MKENWKLQFYLETHKSKIMHDACSLKLCASTKTEICSKTFFVERESRGYSKNDAWFLWKRWTWTVKEITHFCTLIDSRKNQIFAKLLGTRRMNKIFLKKADVTTPFRDISVKNRTFKIYKINYNNWISWVYFIGPTSMSLEKIDWKFKRAEGGWLHMKVPCQDSLF